MNVIRRYSVVVLAAALLAFDCPAFGVPARTAHPFVNSAQSNLGSLVRKEVAADSEEWAVLESYLLAKIESSREMPEVALRLRALLVRLYLELGDQDEATESAKSLLADYRHSRGDRRVRGWLTATLALDSRKLKQASDIYIVSAKSLGIDISDIDQLRRTKYPDYDLDGVGFKVTTDEQGRTTRAKGLDACQGFDDSEDSDGDGVADGCDACWGFPDHADADKDGFPDGCDRCPGQTDFDFDLDDVPDGCDNCVGKRNPMEPRPADDRKHEPDCTCDTIPPHDCCWQPDGDNDGMGDPCDISDELKVVAIRDASGRTLESFDYNERGDLIRSVKWGDEENAMLVKTFEYDQYHRLTASVQEPFDGSGPPTTTKYFYDDKGEEIGRITDGKTKHERFRYRDENGHVVKVTAAADPPETAVVLEAYTYDAKGRMTDHRRRFREDGPLESVEAHTFVDMGEEKYQETIRRRIDSTSERMTIETREFHGQLIERIEYAEAISPRGGQPKDTKNATRSTHDVYFDENGHILHEWYITSRPDGIRTVEGWEITGSPYALGSKKIVERYETRHEHPSDAEKLNHYREVEEYFEEGLAYQIVMSSEPDGSTTTYVRDPENPHNALIEVRKSTIGDQVVEYRTAYKYDGSGRVLEEQRTSPDERQTIVYEYDYRGRPVYERRDNGRYIRERFVKYDAFDNMTVAYSYVQGSGFSMTYPDWGQELARRFEQRVQFRASGSGVGSADLDSDGGFLFGQLAITKRDAKNAKDRTIRNQAKEHLKELLGPLLRDKAEPMKYEEVHIVGADESLLIESDLAGPGDGHTGFWLLVATAGDDVWTVSLLTKSDRPGNANAQRTSSILRECVESFCLVPRKCARLSLFELVE